MLLLCMVDCTCLLHTATTMSGGFCIRQIALQGLPHLCSACGALEVSFLLLMSMKCDTDLYSLCRPWSL